MTRHGTGRQLTVKRIYLLGPFATVSSVLHVQIDQILLESGCGRSYIQWPMPIWELTGEMVAAAAGAWPQVRRELNRCNPICC